MEIITGYVGKAHVKAEQDRDINQGIIGQGSYVLKTGMQLAAEVSSNNEIKIRDGVLMHQGCAASIKKNTYDSLTIINGSQGMKRIDLIIARYEKDQNNGTESLELKVIQGTPAEANAEVPSYTEGDIQAGDYVADMPLYKVIIDGLNITEVKKVFEIVGPNKDLTDRIPIYGTTPIIETGANSYKDTSVKFGKTFSKAPFVLLTLSGGSQNTKTFAAQVKDVSTTGMTIRTVNGYNSSVSMFINWCAFPSGGE